MGSDFMTFVFWMLSFKPAFHSPLTFIKRLLSSSLLSAIRVVSLHIWGYWYFSQQSWFQLLLIKRKLIMIACYRFPVTTMNMAACSPDNARWQLHDIIDGPMLFGSSSILKLLLIYHSICSVRKWVSEKFKLSRVIELRYKTHSSKKSFHFPSSRTYFSMQIFAHKLYNTDIWYS